MSIPLGNRVVAFARVTSPVSGDRPNVLIGRNVLQKLGQHGREGAMGRQRVLKSGTSQPNPTNFSKLSTKPVVCRSGMPKSPGLRPFRAELTRWINSRTPFTLQCQAGLDRGVPELSPPTAFTRR